MKQNYLIILLFVFAFVGCEKDKVSNLVTAEFSFPYKDTLSILTYNVAGLPELISSGNPTKYTSEIGRRLNHYSLVAVQEDFNYNHLLYGTAQHLYKTKWMGPVPIGDGLNVLSDYKIYNMKRVKWMKCHGTDCLTPKGFQFQQIEIANGFKIDVYNLHTNAGSEDKRDIDSRRANILQVFNYIQKHSKSSAVLVLGDFNSRYTRTRDTLEIFTQFGFKDTWIEYVRDGILPDKDDNSLMDCENTLSPMCETVDRIFYRSNENIKFRLLDYDKSRENFQQNGDDLSDHIPIYSLLEVTISNRP